MNEYQTMRGEAALLGVSYSTIRRMVDRFRPLARATDLIEYDQTIRIRHEWLCECIKNRKEIKK